MKWLLILLLEYRVKRVDKIINKYKLANDSILARAFTDAKKSYESAIMFLKAEKEGEK